MQAPAPAAVVIGKAKRIGAAMTPAAAKLLMCICAGSGGAALVPVAERVRTAIKARPAVARMVRRPVAQPAARPVAVVPPLVCPRTVAAGGSIGQVADGLDSLVGAIDDGSGFSTPGSGGILPSGAGSTTGGGGLGGGASFDGVGGPGGGLVGAGTGGVIARVPEAPAMPTNSPTPEPATWLLMIGGLGAVGAAMRRARRVAGSA